MADADPSPAPPPPDWIATLHAQGRSVTWLAERVGVSRTYLHDVAAGRKHASTELAAAIASHLAAPDRLAQAREHAGERVRWMRVEQLARQLADEIAKALDA